MPTHTTDYHFAFIAEWFQREASMKRTFQLFYHSKHGTVEIHEVHNKKLFLKPTRMPHLSVRDFFIGSKVEILGRHFLLVEYADTATSEILGKHRTKTFILLKSHIIAELGRVLCALVEAHFHVDKGLRVQLVPSQVREFLDNRGTGDMDSAILMHELNAGPCIGLEISGDNALEKIKYCMGQRANVDPTAMPTDLMKLFEKEDFRHGVYSAQDDSEAKRNSEFFFGAASKLRSTLAFRNSTLCIIKPHAIKEGKLGEIVTDITENGFEITGLRVLLMKRMNSNEFLEVYNTVTSDYNTMAAQLSSGVVMALELICKDPTKTAYPSFRNFCGPKDPEFARALRPGTLRAKYGVGKVDNAVHTTDMEEDIPFELRYMFKIVE